jgi:hypothetical protein
MPLARSASSTGERSALCLFTYQSHAPAAVPRLSRFDSQSKKTKMEERAMGFNYAREKLQFDAEWRKLAAEYRAAGFVGDDSLPCH